MERDNAREGVDRLVAKVKGFSEFVIIEKTAVAAPDAKKELEPMVKNETNGCGEFHAVEGTIDVPDDVNRSLVHIYSRKIKDGKEDLLLFTLINSKGENTELFGYGFDTNNRKSVEHGTWNKPDFLDANEREKVRVAIAKFMENGRGNGNENPLRLSAGRETRMGIEQAKKIIAKAGLR